MTTIFHVKSNLNHDGVNYPTGSFFEGEQSAFQSLINDGVLEVVDGANSLSEARRIVALKEAEAPAETPVEQQPENTWEAKPDPVPTLEDQNVDPATNTDVNTDANVGAPENKPEDVPPQTSGTPNDL